MFYNTPIKQINRNKTMDNKLTPMRRLNTNFRTLRGLMEDHYDRRILSQPEKADFLLKFKKKDDDLSLFISINYLNNFDNPEFNVSIKYDTIIADESNVMDINEFREKLNLLNKVIAENPKTEKADLFAEIFFNGTFDAKKIKKEAKKEVI